MKKLLLSLLTVFILFPAMSQELKQMQIIGNPKKLESGEMVARRDANGNYCAAIQVISDMDGFSYDSWNGVVGDVDSKPGKDMVFLTASERVLEVFKEGYKPLQIILSDYSINLQPREVWQIEIAGEEKAETLPVVIRYAPEDAQLFIDGVEMEKAKTYSLALGEHQVKIIKEGYQEHIEQITVDQNNVYFEFQLERIKDAALQLTTTPEGATIFIDGIKMGETPVAAFHPPGTYPIRIVKEGFVTIEDETIEIAAPSTRKDYKLEENVGYLTVNTHENATVYFNGETITNPQKVKLAPQLVKVKVTMPKADDLEQQVLLKKHDDIVLDMHPEVKTGTIQVAVTPFDAEIKIYKDSRIISSGVGTITIESLEIGDYKVVSERIGYFPVIETVTILQDEVSTLKIKLEQERSIFINSNPQNADVFINGSRVGKTPVEIQVSNNTNEISIKKDGYENSNFTISKNDEQKEFLIDLEKNKFQLSVRSVPTSSQVFINGKLVGTTPLLSKYKAAKYRVKIRRDGYKPAIETVNLEKNYSLTKSLIKRKEVNWISDDWKASGVNMGYYLGFNAFFLDFFFYDYFTMSIVLGENNLSVLDFVLTYKFNIINDLFSLKPFFGYGWIDYDLDYNLGAVSYGVEFIMFPKYICNFISGFKYYSVGNQEFPNELSKTNYYLGLRVDMGVIFNKL